MKLHLLSLTLLLFFFFFLTLSHGLNPKCNIPDRGSTLQVFHVFSTCSPFRPSKPVSWEENVLQMQAKDQARLQFLSSLVAGKSVVPIASGRQIIQSPTYIVRAKIGTPAQTMLMAMDTSNDAAWIPCTGCVGCGSTVFNSATSSSFKPVGCQAAQCKQVMQIISLFLQNLGSSIVNFICKRDQNLHDNYLNRISKFKPDCQTGSQWVVPYDCCHYIYIHISISFFFVRF